MVMDSKGYGFVSFVEMQDAFQFLEVGPGFFLCSVCCMGSSFHIFRLFSGLPVSIVMHSCFGLFHMLHFSMQTFDRAPKAVTVSPGLARCPHTYRMAVRLRFCVLSFHLWDCFLFILFLGDQGELCHPFLPASELSGRHSQVNKHYSLSNGQLYVISVSSYLAFCLVNPRPQTTSFSISAGSTRKV